MSKANLAAFVSKLASDEKLTTEVNASTAGKSTPEATAAVAAIGQAAGYDFTAAEASEFYESARAKVPVSEKELETVAGGIGSFGGPPPFVLEPSIGGPTPFPSAPKKLVDPIYMFDPEKGTFTNW